MKSWKVKNTCRHFRRGQILITADINLKLHLLKASFYGAEAPSVTWSKAKLMIFVGHCVARRWGNCFFLLLAAAFHHGLHHRLPPPRRWPRRREEQAQEIQTRTKKPIYGHPIYTIIGSLVCSQQNKVTCHFHLQHQLVHQHWQAFHLKSNYSTPTLGLQWKNGHNSRQNSKGVIQTGGGQVIFSKLPSSSKQIAIDSYINEPFPSYMSTHPKNHPCVVDVILFHPRNILDQEGHGVRSCGVGSGSIP